MYLLFTWSRALYLFADLHWVLYQANATSVSFRLELVLLLASDGMIEQLFLFYKKPNMCNCMSQLQI
jgi:hypothetical protein